jgi:hypothetical protein
MKRRATIKDLCNLDSGDRVIVRCNKSYVPDTKAAYLLSSFLNDLASNETYAPLSILTWDNVCFDDYKTKMIRLIEVYADLVCSFSPKFQLMSYTYYVKY